MSQPFNPAPQPVPPAPPAQKRKRFGWLAMIIAVACTFAIGSCTGAMARGAGGTTAAPQPTVTVTAKAGPAEKPAEKPAEDPEPADEPAGLADGTYEVGVDVEPGRYKTTVPDDSMNCYWARLKDDSGELDAIIANENQQPGSRVSVTIKKSDGFFTSKGCGEWTKS